MEMPTSSSSSASAPIVFDLVVSRHADAYRYRADSVATGQLEGILTTSPEALLGDAWSTGFPALDNEQRIRYGRRLFDALFQGDLLRHFDRFRSSAQAADKLSVLQLRFRNADLLAGIPWERMHDGLDFVGKDKGSSIVRYLESDRPVRSVRIEPPLRILLTGGLGDEDPDPCLKNDIAAIDKAYKDAPVPVSMVAQAKITWDQFKALFRQATRDGKPYHIWQHVGHGKVVQGQYHLQFSGETISFERIQEFLEPFPSLQVVILSSCHSAALEGAAQKLAQSNVPLVFGFREAVAANVARELTAALHLLLLRESPEIALCMARSSVASEHPETFEWAQAMLYSRRQAPLLPLVAIPERPAVRPRRPPASQSSGGSTTVRAEGIRAGRDVDIVGVDGSSRVGKIDVQVKEVDAGRDFHMAGSRSSHSQYEDLLKDLFLRINQAATPPER